MTEMRKITAFLPAKLVATAQSATGEGVTETLRRALEALNHAEWCRKMLELEGQVPLELDLDALRADRSFDADGSAV